MGITGSTCQAVRDGGGGHCGGDGEGERGGVSHPENTNFISTLRLLASRVHISTRCFRVGVHLTAADTLATSSADNRRTTSTRHLDPTESPEAIGKKTGPQPPAAVMYRAMTWHDLVRTGVKPVGGSEVTP